MRPSVARKLYFDAGNQIQTQQNFGPRNSNSIYSKFKLHQNFIQSYFFHLEVQPLRLYHHLRNTQYIKEKVRQTLFPRLPFSVPSAFNSFPSSYRGRGSWKRRITFCRVKMPRSYLRIKKKSERVDADWRQSFHVRQNGGILSPSPCFSSRFVSPLLRRRRIAYLEVATFISVDLLASFIAAFSNILLLEIIVV